MRTNQFLLGIGVFLCVSSNAAVHLSDTEYRFAVLNYSIEAPEGVITFKDILKLIEEQTMYNIVNKVDEIPIDKKFVGLNKYKRVGELLDAVLDGYDAVVDVDFKNRIIKIIYPEVVYIDLPYSWDMRHTKKEFEKKFPHIKFYVEGNRLTAYGLPRDIAKLIPVFKTYQKIAFKRDSFKISLYPYCTDIDKWVFLGRRKYYGSEEFKPIKFVRVSLGQGEKVSLLYKDVNINITYDKSHSLFHIGKYDIPTDKISRVGLVFKPKNKGSSDSVGYVFTSLIKSVKTGIKSAIKENPENRGSCDDVILTIDKILPLY